MSTVVTCPSCAAPLTGASASCPTCGLPLSGPVAMRLWQVDQHIAALHVERSRLLEQLRHGLVDTDAVRPDAPGLGVGEPDAIEQRRRRSTWTGKQLLLGAGVLLVLVASLVFLAVAWSLIGVLGQVAVMGVLTTAAAVTSLQLARRDLRSTAEAVGILAVGMAVVDVAAARALDLAGLADVDAGTYAMFASVGVAVVAAWLAQRPVRVRTFSLAAVAASAAAAVSALAAFVPQEPAAVAAWLCACGVGFGLAAVRLTGVWEHVRMVNVIAAAGFVAVGLVVALPAIFVEDLVGDAGASAAVSLVMAAALAVTASRMGSTTPAPAGLQALDDVALWVAVVLTVSISLVGLASHGDRAGLLALALVAALIAALIAALAAGAAAARGTTSAAATASTVLLVVPVHLTALLAVGMLFLETFSPYPPLGVAPLVVGLVAIGASAAVTAFVASDRPVLRSAAAGYAGLAWWAAAVTGSRDEAGVVMVAVLVAYALASAAVAGWRHGHGEEVAVGAVSLLASLTAAVVAADERSAAPLAVVFAAAGVTALAYALLPGRGLLAIAGVLGCSAATWTMAVAHDVEMVEAYSLPLAALAGLVGLVRLRRQPHAPSWATTGPALTAALLPSAVATIDDPALLRPLLVLAAGALAAFAGVAGRWQAPLATGALAVVIVAFSQLAPYAIGMPRWASLGAVGLALLLLGARYEQRRRDAAQMVAWVKALH